ncbi:hypothetical protein GCM10027435_20040 [Haloparvum alkalitolerans]
MRDEGLAGDREHRLRERVRERTHPRSLSGREHDGLHIRASVRAGKEVATATARRRASGTDRTAVVVGYATGLTVHEAYTSRTVREVDRSDTFSTF